MYGQAAAPPIKVMNSRRLMTRPRNKIILHRKTVPPEGAHNVRFGSEADMCAAIRHVRFAPNSDRKSGLPRKAMSALPPKADMCSALAYVCFGPKAEVASLIDDFVGADERRRALSRRLQ